MAVSSYQKNGVTLWMVYLDLKSRKDRTLRAQKRVTGFSAQGEAEAEEKKILRMLTEKLARLESKGIRWSEVIARWERHHELYPTKRLSKSTIRDYVALLNNWTGPWRDRIASELNRGDGRELLRLTEEAGKSGSFCKHLKHTINNIYKWGIEEKLILGVRESPVHGVDISPDRGEKVPEILTVTEIQDFLRLAREQRHPWYPIWVTALLTGCRSGELQGLKRSDVEIVSRDQALIQDRLPADQRRYGVIRVRRSWSSDLKEIGPTKAGYWRSVPVSSELYWFLVEELKLESIQAEAPLLPAFSDWRLGLQAMILRGFCQANGLPSVKFHTLRACFATQLISSGVPATIVMKICGWKDMKTMQRYIRLAGIDEAGATERLKVIPSDAAVMERVVSLFDFKKG